MPFILLFLTGLVFYNPAILFTENNEGAFSVRKIGDRVCLVGRMDNGKDYDALVGVLGGDFFRISSERDDYSYTVESFGDRCIAGITTLAKEGMDMVLVEFGRGRPKVLKAIGGPGDNMLWFMKRVSGGYLLVGGVKEGDWDILIVRLNGNFSVEWSLRIGTGKHEYAYGAVEHRGTFYVVGRSNFRGNWDGFVLELTNGGRLKRSYLVGSEAKDYLRFVGLFKGKVLAVGRSEARGDSDVWIFSEEGSFLFDGGEFDYGRVFVPWEGGIALMGDTYTEGQSDGMLLFLNERLEFLEGYRLGGEDVESIRFLTEEGWFAGYSYSFSLDNDILLGNARRLCKEIASRENFERFVAPVRLFSYPVQIQPYPLQEIDLNLRIEKIRLKRKDPCSGVDEGFDPAD